MAEQEHDRTDETSVEETPQYEAPQVEDLETADGPAVTAAGVSGPA